MQTGYKMYLVTAEEMQEMDRLTIETFGIPGRVLMESAGRGAFRTLLDHFPGIHSNNVGIIAGRGNNGGDGFVIARYLKQKKIDVTVYLLAQQKNVSGDAAANLNLLAPLSVPIIEIPDESSFSKHKTSMRHQNIWVDAILGTGLKSDVKSYFRKIIEFINNSNRPVFSVDIPSGLNSDTGQPRGVCIQARHTATFAYPKIGHFVHPGADYTGNLDVVDIGIPPHIADNVDPGQKLITNELIKKYYIPRPHDAHKGNAGHLLVVAGSPGKTGAAAMTAMSAMRSGAGLVTLGIPGSLNPILETQLFEVMTQSLPETHDGLVDAKASDMILNHLLTDKKCLAIGPGLGQSDETTGLVKEIISGCTVPIVMDADGINNLAGEPMCLKKANVPVILTPHPGEMARLLGISAKSVQKDRINTARNFAKEFNVHIVLKGARTVIAHPDGKIFINPTGNPGMATGGMGDVLTGVIAGLITQGYPIEHAAHTGVYLHGAAADILSQTNGPVGYLAGEVMNAIPNQIQKIWRPE